MLNVPVIPITQEPDVICKARQTAAKWQLPYKNAAEQGLVLIQDRQVLALKQLDEPKLGNVLVDFASDTLTFRREKGGGKKEAIAKAVGCKGQHLPHVVDATAGLGRDAFVLASLGCKVDMIERSSVVAALLDDGLERIKQHQQLSRILSMRLFHGVSYAVLTHWLHEKPDVVYLDPMFPHKQKSALVKKEMRLFQQLLGADQDADQLLAPAMALANNRVVVKRPSYAPPLADQCPSMCIESKKHRFDVYLKNCK